MLEGEDTHQGGHEAAELRGLIGGAAKLFAQVGEEACPVEHVGQSQADDAGDGGGAHEIEHGLPAHGAHLLHVVHGEDAVDHGNEHHGYHDELQQVDEDVAEGLDEVSGDALETGAAQHSAHGNAQQQSQQDLEGRLSFFFFIDSPQAGFCVSSFYTKRTHNLVYYNKGATACKAGRKGTVKFLNNL